MSDLRKAVEELMPILERWKITYPPCSGADWDKVEALRTALAQTEQEPVAWGIANTRPTEKNPLMMVMLDEPKPSHLVVPLYTAPPKREWVGLTDDEIYDCADKFLYLAEFVRTIEAKLKEKNT